MFDAALKRIDAGNPGRIVSENAIQEPASRPPFPAADFQDTEFRNIGKPVQKMLPHTNVQAKPICGKIVSLGVNVISVVCQGVMV
jgi:hypothetical protein